MAPLHKLRQNEVLANLKASIQETNTLFKGTQTEQIDGDLLQKLEKQVYKAVFLDVYDKVSRELKLTEQDEARIANEVTESIETLLNYKQSQI